MSAACLKIAKLSFFLSFACLESTPVPVPFELKSVGSHDCRGLHAVTVLHVALLLGITSDRRSLRVRSGYVWRVHIVFSLAVFHSSGLCSDAGE